MNLAKFISLLDRKALFFTQGDLFSDPLEGYYPKTNVEMPFDPNLPGKFIPNDQFRKTFGKTCKQDYEDALKKYLQHSKKWRKYVAANCWSMNPHESAAMWKLYLSSNEGVAVRSTFGHLKSSFYVCLNYEINIGKVKYVDHGYGTFSESFPISKKKDTSEFYNEARKFMNNLVPMDFIASAFFAKQKSYEYEHELRALITAHPKEPGKSAYKPTEDPNMEEFDPSLGGDYVSVDLDVLIDKVYISPEALIWFGDLVESVSERYCLNKEIVKSGLADRPLY